MKGNAYKQSFLSRNLKAETEPSLLERRMQAALSISLRISKLMAGPRGGQRTEQGEPPKSSKN